jgi:sec-independent protein translocase protein TatC
MTSEAARSKTPDKSATRGTFDASRMSFGDHLDELRNCLIRGLLGVVLATVASLIYGKEILKIVCDPLIIVQHANGLQPNLQALAPTAGFIAYLKIGFLSGLVISMPWLIYQIWRFVASGLYPRERRFGKWLIGPSTALFVLGVLFLYYIVLPIVLQFFISFNRNFGTPDLTPTMFQRLLLRDREEVPETEELTERVKLSILQNDPENPAEGETWVNSTTNRLMLKTPSGILSAPLEVGPFSPVMHSQFAIDFYVSFVLTLALAFGIAFETPIVVFFLAWTGIVSTAAMKRARRYVLFVIVVLAAVLTPPDVISQLLLAGPMYLLFEIGLLVARAVERKVSPEAAG